MASEEDTQNTSTNWLHDHEAECTLSKHADEIIPGLWLGSESAGLCTPLADLQHHQIILVAIPAYLGRETAECQPHLHHRIQYYQRYVVDVAGYPLLPLLPSFCDVIEMVLKIKSMRESMTNENNRDQGGENSVVISRKSVRSEDAFETLFEEEGDGMKKRQGSVLVHCAEGVSRSASVVIGYLMYSLGVSMDDARRHVQSKRKKICVRRFEEQLRGWEKMKCDWERREEAGLEKSMLRMGVKNKKENSFIFQQEEGT